MNQTEFKKMKTYWESLKVEMNHPTPNNPNIITCMNSMDEFIQKLENKNRKKKLSPEEKEKKTEKTNNGHWREFDPSSDA